jgi:glutamate dehydrogenase
MSTNPSHDDKPMDDAAATSAQPASEPTGVGERTALLQLERATGMLHEHAPDAPVDFVIRLFAGAAAEDLLRYQPQELAELAAASWHFLAERAPRTAKIRVSNPDGGPRLDNISVIELVNDDMPFLVDSVMGELNHRGLETYLLVHPVFRVARDAAGKLIRFGNGIEAAPLRESIIQVHVDRIDDEAARSALAGALAGVVSDVRLAVQDWRSMLDRVGGIIDSLKTDPPPLPEDDVTETIAFL